MNARLLLALALLLIATAVHAQEAEPAWLEVADVALRLRSGPSTEDDIISRLTPREAVELLQRGEQWSRVRRQDGQAGWAHNDYLLPWDERNRVDALRRVGEQRLFRVAGQHRHAELRVVSESSYIYTVANRASGFLPDDAALQRLGELFDERIYRQALDLWGIEDAPHINGDRRILILIASGFDPDFEIGGWYSVRDGLPNEPGHAGDIGFLGIMLHEPNREALESDFANFVMSALAHEFGHLLHHQAGDNHAPWVSEGLATFSQEYLENEGLLDPTRLVGSFSTAGIQLNRRQNPDYFTSMLFMVYIYERLGLEALREFAARPEQGLDALDAVLAERSAGMDADDFFADWVLGNYLLDTRREGGRYGYQMLDKSDIAQPAPSNHIRQYPGGFRDATRPYSAAYYELPLHDDSDASGQILLDFRLADPAPQDAWLQLVQVLPERIDVQRFRAGDYRNQPVLASLSKQPQRVFVAISPFTPSARQRTRPVTYSLAIRQQPAPAEPRAQVTATLNLRSNPAIADNILAKLQPCSLVQVLQRTGEWSQVLTDEGLAGWSHNDYLFHLHAPSPGASANPCAALARAAHDGNLAAVQGLLAGGANVNAGDAFGRSALHEAAFWGHRDILRHLLRAGADVNARDNTGRTPLDEIMLSGDSESILLLLQADTGLDLSDPEFRPLMINAAASGNSDLLGKILASNHDANWRDADGRTALAAAAENGQFATLRQLLAAGADAQHSDRAGRTPLLLAAAGGRPGTFRPLLEAGAQVNRLDLEGHSPLTRAAANGHALAVAWLLLDSQADVHHTLPESGRNALHLAAAAGHEDVVAMLLLSDIDIQARDAQGRSARQLAGAAGHERAARYLRMADPAQEAPAAGPTGTQRSDLLAAARRGDLGEVERLLAGGARVQIFDDEGLTPLMLAARSGHPDVVLRLLLAGAHPDARENTRRDEPALFFTIRDGHDDITAMLLLAGAFPAALEHSTPRMSALMWAADFGREDVVHLLLGLRDHRRLNVNERDYSGWTPLFPAVRNEHVNIVRVLLAAGADPNLRPFSPFQSSSVMRSARNRGNREIIELLHAAGADLNFSSPAALPLMVDAAAQGNNSLLELILAEGHDVNWQDAYGRTALAAAASSGQGASLKLLLDAGANPQWQDENGRSLLMLAATRGDIETLNLLHGVGADVNHRDRAGHSALTRAAANGNADTVAWLLLSEQVDVGLRAPPEGRNALHLAAAAGHDDVVALLLLGDVDVNAADASEQTALQLAATAGHGKIEELLRIALAAESRGKVRVNPDSSTRENSKALRAAVRAGNLQEIGRLVEAGVGLSGADDQGMTALMLAAGAGERAVVLRLLLAGAAPNARQTGFRHHQTALYHSIQSGHDDISAMLLLVGGNPEGYDYKTPGPLHWATKFGRPDIVRLLLNLPGSRRVHVDARSYGDKTALHEAARLGRREILELLLAAGADPNARDDGPAAPLDFAITWQHVDVVERLLAAGADPDGIPGSRNSPLDLARDFVRNRVIVDLLLEAGAEG